MITVQTDMMIMGVRESPDPRMMELQRKKKISIVDDLVETLQIIESKNDRIRRLAKKIKTIEDLVTKWVRLDYDIRQISETLKKNEAKLQKKMKGRCPLCGNELSTMDKKKN